MHCQSKPPHGEVAQNAINAVHNTTTGLLQVGPARRNSTCPVSAPVLVQACSTPRGVKAQVPAPPSGVAPDDVGTVPRMLVQPRRVRPGSAAAHAQAYQGQRHGWEVVGQLPC